MMKTVTRAVRITRRAYATGVPNGAATSQTAKASKPRTAMFFPGQGVQRVGMLKPWLEAFPKTCKPFAQEMDDILQMPMTRLIEEGRNDTLTATENAQPAIMATSVMILRVLEEEFGFKTEERVDVTLGHSLGEFAALIAGGYLKGRDSLWLVRKRAEIMAQCAQEARKAEGGEVGMVALICEPDRFESMIEAIHDFVGPGSSGSKSDSAEDIPLGLQQVIIANINSKNQVVLSGSIARIRTLLTNLREFGGHDPRSVRLKSDCPFHSPLLMPATELMKRILRKPTKDGRDMVRFPGHVPCISNVTARPFESKHQLEDLLARQCSETVRWWDSIKYLHQEDKVRRWIGIGPGKVGRNLVGKEVGMKGAVRGGGVWAISEPKEVEEVMKDLLATDVPYEDD